MGSAAGARRAAAEIRRAGFLLLPTRPVLRPGSALLHPPRGTTSPSCRVLIVRVVVVSTSLGPHRFLRPATPLLRAERPLLRAERPFLRAERPLLRPESPLARPASSVSGFAPTTSEVLASVLSRLDSMETESTKCNVKLTEIAELSRR